MLRRGILRITTVKEGQPFNAGVNVFDQSTNKAMPSKGTWSHNKPAEYELVPGIYYLKVTDRSVLPYQTQEVQDIKIAFPVETVEKTVPFVAGGILRITTVKEGQPFNASVNVFDQSTNKAMPGKGSWYHNKPAEYQLVPGVYSLRVTDRSEKPFKTKDVRDIEVVSGQTAEQNIEF